MNSDPRISRDDHSLPFVDSSRFDDTADDGSDALRDEGGGMRDEARGRMQEWFCLLQNGEPLIMNNLDYSSIAIEATIVALLNLVVVVLVKTETIIKYVERIKGALKLDYRSRAKRIDDEMRLLKKNYLLNP